MVYGQQTVGFGHKKQHLTVAGFHHNIVVVIDGQRLNVFGKLAVLLFIRMTNRGRNTVDLDYFHMLVIIIQKENLQKPYQKHDSKTECGKVHPQTELDAFGIEFNLRTQIYNLPL